LHGELRGHYEHDPEAWFSEWTPAVEAGWDGLLGTVKTMLSYDRLTTVSDVAAAILFRGTTTQYMTEGNKRLATAAMNAQLLANGYILNIDDESMIAFVGVIANSSPQLDPELAIKPIARYLRANSTIAK
jgi:prophage maintenance system killer protein